MNDFTLCRIYLINHKISPLNLRCLVIQQYSTIMIIYNEYVVIEQDSEIVAEENWNEEGNSNIQCILLMV